MLTITAQQVGQTRNLIKNWHLPLPENWIGQKPTLRELLTEIVTAEVAAFTQRQRDNQLLKVLTASAITQAAQQGKIDSGGKEFLQEVDSPQAMLTTLQGFDDGLYFVFIDEQQQESLDQLVSLNSNSQVLFLRLVPLVGG